MALISSFYNMKRPVDSISTPSGWDARPWQGYPSIKFASTYSHMHLGGERHCESKTSHPRTQHNAPGQLKPRPLNLEVSVLVVRPLTNLLGVFHDVSTLISVACVVVSPLHSLSAILYPVLHFVHPWELSPMQVSQAE